MAERHGTQQKLSEELERLRQATGLGHNLTLRWIPTKGSNLSGEVREDVIHIYDEEEAKALQTLVHEFLDYMVSQAIEPYKTVTNALIKLINDDAYGRKEKVVESLTRVLTACNQEEALCRSSQTSRQASAGSGQDRVGKFGLFKPGRRVTN